MAIKIHVANIDAAVFKQLSVIGKAYGLRMVMDADRPPKRGESIFKLDRRLKFIDRRMLDAFREIYSGLCGLSELNDLYYNYENRIRKSFDK